MTPSAILKAAACKLKKPCYDSTVNELGAFQDGQEVENARLTPLLTALADVACAADQALRQWEMYMTDMAQNDLVDLDHAEAQELKRSKQALAKLAELVGE